MSYPVRSSRVNITLSDDQRLKLDAIAQSKGTQPTTLASRIVSAWLEGYEERELLHRLIKDKILGSFDND